MFFAVSGRLLTGLGVVIALGNALLVWASKTSDSRSLDPAPCVSGEERVAFSNLTFCWPTGADAPDYSFEMPETMQGSQEIKGESTAFTIFPIDSTMFEAFRDEIARKERIARAAEMRTGDADVFAIDLYEGKNFGRHAFEFRKVSPKLFAASKVLSAEGWPSEQIEYWVAITDDGKVDYVMRCRTLGTAPNCYSQFFLFENLVRIGTFSAKNADGARNAFEVLRSRIRSYVVSPNSTP